MRHPIKRPHLEPYFIACDPTRDCYRVYRRHEDGTATPDPALYYSQQRAVAQARIYKSLESTTGEIRFYDGMWWVGAPKPADRQRILEQQALARGREYAQQQDNYSKMMELKE